MRDHRVEIDDVTRVFALKVGARRGVLGLATASLLGGLLTRLGLKSAVAGCQKRGQKCGPDQRCCFPDILRCHKGHCRCRPGLPNCGKGCCPPGCTCETSGTGELFCLC